MSQYHRQGEAPGLAKGKDDSQANAHVPDMDLSKQVVMDTC